MVLKNIFIAGLFLSFVGTSGFELNAATLLPEEIDLDEYYETADFEKVSDVELDALEKAVLEQEVNPDNPLVSVGRYAYYRGFLLQNSRSDLSKDKAKVALKTCIKKSTELPLDESLFVQKYAWNLFCSMQLFKLSIGNTAEMKDVLVPASNLLRELVEGQQGNSWLDIKPNIRISNNNSSFQLYPSYYGGLVYRALAEIYVQMEIFFVRQDPLAVPMVYLMQDIVGGTQTEQTQKFRKQLCLRAREFYQKAIAIDELDSELDRSGEEFLANYRVGAETESICGAKDKAKELVEKAGETFEMLKTDEYANAEDKAEIGVFKKISAKLLK